MLQRLKNCIGELKLRHFTHFCNMHLVRAPFFVRAWYAACLWHKSRTEKKVYLTFDDGPIPDITPWVLDTLREHDVKATFFCVGDNIQKHPNIFARIQQEGHRVGNHTYNHVKGWLVDDEQYLQNIAKCQKLTNTRLFRPPYGRIKQSQIRQLKDQYKIVMWDVLTGDYDTKISPERCLKYATRYTKNGSIIVFHDSLKASRNLKHALPKTLTFLKEKGFTFETL